MKTPGEIHNWLATVEAEWRDTFKREVSDVHEAGLARLREWYLDSILEAGAALAQHHQTYELLVLRKEHRRFSDTGAVPAQDNAWDALPVKELRGRWWAQIAQMEEDRAARAKRIHAGHDHVLAQMQTSLTERRWLDEALLVKNKRAELAAGVPAPDAAAREALFGTQPGMGLAKVDVEDMIFEPLAKDAKLWSDREVRLLNIPARFKYHQFTQATAYVTTLRFKVLTDGLVYMGCSTRRNTRETPEVAKDLTTAESLKQDGWTPVPAGEITTTSKELSLEIHSRPCKAGEMFSYHTETYSPPILLVK